MIVRPLVEHYAEEHTTPHGPCLAALAAETRQVSDTPYMMVGPLEGQLLATLVYALRPRLVLEVGTFTGYSALAMAEALPPNGRIVTCEVDPGHAAVAERHVAASPYADRIEIRLGPALATIDTLPGPFDLVFIDADKTGYPDYYRAVLPKLSPHGLLVVDNTLHRGHVVGDQPGDAEVAVLRRFNEMVREDPRVRQVVLTVRDGLTLIRPASAFSG